MSQIPPPARAPGPDVAFVTCIERGFLEEQSLLLYESIRQFGGRFSSCPIYGFSPRPGHEVTTETIAAMERLEVTYIDKPLNTEIGEFAYANKNFAAAYVERTSRHKSLVFLDSDTLFFREPALLELADDVDVRVRPVNWKNIGSMGSEDPNDKYWRSLAELCRVDLDSLPYLETSGNRARTSGDQAVRAYYNGGLVAVRSERGIFQRWEENIIAAHRVGLSPQPGNFWGSGQSTLCMAIHSAPHRVDILPRCYNYGLRSLSAPPPEDQVHRSHDLVHIHYHKRFEEKHLSNCGLFAPEFEWETEIRDWLLARLPLGESARGIRWRDKGTRRNSRPRRSGARS
jgi:hypothetical protein